MIDCSCPACGKQYQLNDNLRGKQVRCLGCERVFTVPRPGQPEGTPGTAANEGFPPAPPESAEPTMADDTPQPDNKVMTLLSLRIAPGVTASFALLAILMFFLPWIKLSCAQMELGSQSGYQIATGGISYSTQMEALKEKSHESARSADADMGVATENNLKSDWPLFFAPAILLFVTLIGIVTFVLPDGMKHPTWIVASVLCAVALVLIIVYLFLGFDAERQMDKSKKEALARTNTSGINLMDTSGEQIGAAMMTMVGSTRLPALYFFVTFLALACLSSATAGILIAKLPRSDLPTEADTAPSSDAPPTTP